jgi:hypothetical protein
VSTEPEQIGPEQRAETLRKAREEMARDEMLEGQKDFDSWLTKEGYDPIKPDEVAPAVDWFIKDICPFDGIALLSADAKAGKSSLLYDLAIGSALGTGSLKGPDGKWALDVGGKPVKTLYVDTENSRGLCIRRVDTLCRERGVDKKQILGRTLYILPLARKKIVPHLKSDSASMQENKERALTFAQMVKKAGYRVVIFDILRDCFPYDELGRGENDGAFIARMYELMSVIVAETGACVLIAHHHNKSGDESKGSKSTSGHNTIQATPHTLLSLFEMRKDYEENEDRDFKLLVSGRETKGGTIHLKGRSSFDDVCRVFESVPKPVKEKKPPGRQSGDRRKIAGDILDAVLFKEPGLLDRQTKPSEWLQLVSRVNQAEEEWQKSPDTLRAYLTEELVSAGRVLVIDKARGIYQVVR